MGNLVTIRNLKTDRLHAVIAADGPPDALHGFYTYCGQVIDYADGAWREEFDDVVTCKVCERSLIASAPYSSALALAKAAGEVLWIYEALIGLNPEHKRRLKVLREAVDDYWRIRHGVNER